MGRVVAKLKHNDDLCLLIVVFIMYLCSRYLQYIQYKGRYVFQSRAEDI